MEKYRVTCKDYCDNDEWQYNNLADAEEQYAECVKYQFSLDDFTEDDNGNTLEDCLAEHECEICGCKIMLEEYMGYGHWEKVWGLASESED